MSGGEEFARFARDLTRAALVLGGAGEVVAAVVGRGALATARRLAPVDTGQLRQELELIRRGETSIIQSSTRYAVFQEYGTSVMAPDPFVGPAVDEWGPRMLREVEKVRDRVVRDLG